MWNHALFKAALSGRGSVIHATHTRDIDQLGSLASRCRGPCGFLVGAVAICGLPPLSGFVSEFLIYLGLFGVEDHAGPSPSFQPRLSRQPAA
jgi:hydrogenase-4 component B